MAEADEAGKLTKAYGFNPVAAQQGLWSTDPIWQANVANASLTHSETSYHYLHTDHLGMPQLATSKEGQTSWKATAEAFGAAGIIQSSITMNLRLPGQYYDSETDTHYNFHRDYKPNLGRYLQSDPIGLDGGVNLFVYTENSPMSTFDPSGAIPIPIVFVQPGFPQGYGCGDESTDIYVPDAYIGYNFFYACRNHDICYGTCGNPKKKCDNNFLRDMLVVCYSSIFPGKLSECIIVAHLYYAAVVQFGGGAYCTAQKEACPDCIEIPGC